MRKVTDARDARCLTQAAGEMRSIAKEHGLARRSKERGMSLVAALFIIVVLALLSLFAVRVGAAGEQDLVAELMQERALAAAQSGIEYGAYRGKVGGACNAPAGAVFNVAFNQGALAGFTATVTCIRLTHVHNGAPYFTWEVSATARRGVYGSADYVARTLTTRTLSTGPP